MMRGEANAQRREFLRALGAAGIAASGLAACATSGGVRASGRVVVVGGGYGGATAAKYSNLWSGGAVDVALVEANATFVSCPLSNLVLGGSKQIADITVGYDGLARRGVKVVRDTATAVDPRTRVVKLASGGELRYDRLILSPGIDMLYDRVPGLNNAEAQARVLHAWKAGPQTVALRRQIEAMRDGGVFAISIPRAPLRCPPGPYERACQVAWYFKRAKPRAKVLILDGNEDVQSKKALFLRAWNEEYKDIVEYRAELRSHRRRRAHAHRQVRDGRRRHRRRAERHPSAPRGQHRRAGRRDHRERQLVRSRLPVIRIDQGPEHSRAGRFDPDRAR